MQGKTGRAAAVHQRGDLMPVDVRGNGFGQRRGDTQLGELCYAPVMHERAVANDLMRWDKLHLSHLYYVKTAAKCQLAEILQALWGRARLRGVSQAHSQPGARAQATRSTT